MSLTKKLKSYRTVRITDNYSDIYETEILELCNKLQGSLMPLKWTGRYVRISEVSKSDGNEREFIMEMNICYYLNGMDTKRLTNSLKEKKITRLL